MSVMDILLRQDWSSSPLHPLELLPQWQEV